VGSTGGAPIEGLGDKEGRSPGRGSEGRSPPEAEAFL